jgi:hypothetical protein
MSGFLPGKCNTDPLDNAGVNPVKVKKDICLNNPPGLSLQTRSMAA